jgi:hypothetical protein
MNLMLIPIGEGCMLFPDTLGNSIYDTVIVHAKHRW